MLNNFEEFTSNPLMNMHHVFRYSGVMLSEPESLATHIVEVQVMGYMLIDKLNNSFGEDISYGVFLEKALHHDLEESLTGDVCRTLKYHNPRVLKELQDVAAETATNIYSKYFEDPIRVTKLWDEAKKGKEGVIVKIVDMLCVANKALREVSLLNNNYFLKVVYEVSRYLTDVKVFVENNSPYNADSTQYLVSLIEDAITKMKTLWDERKDIADKYKILDTTLLEG